MKEKLFSLFFPYSYSRTYFQSSLAMGLIIIISLSTCTKINNSLYNNPIHGKITEILIGYKGGGISKYSGSSTHYYVKLDDYKATFYINDMDLLFEKRNLSSDLLKRGMLLTTIVDKDGLRKLNIQTKTYMNGNKLWPIREDCIQMYGLTIQNREIVSTSATIRELVYHKWFWIFVPLLIYILLCLYIRTGFKYWTQKAENNLDG